MVEGTTNIYWELVDEELTLDDHRKSGKGKGNTGQPNWQNATGLFLLDAAIWVDDLNLDDDYWNATSNDYDEGELVVFDDEWVFNVDYLDSYWWDVKNNDVRLMQVRFYPVFKGNGK